MKTLVLQYLAGKGVWDRRPTYDFSTMMASVERYAKKHGYDYKSIHNEVALRTGVQRPEAYDIWLYALEAMEEYDRVICVDNDIFIREDSPEFPDFDFMTMKNTTGFHGFLNICTGVVGLDKEGATWMHDICWNRDVPAHIVHEQHFLYECLEENKDRVVHLPKEFNWHTADFGLSGGYFVHFAGAQKTHIKTFLETAK